MDESITKELRDMSPCGNMWLHDEGDGTVSTRYGTSTPEIEDSRNHKVVIVAEDSLTDIADRIDARFTAELMAKHDEIDGLKADNEALRAKIDEWEKLANKQTDTILKSEHRCQAMQAKLDASIPAPLDADGVPCRIGDLLEAEEHIPRKAVGYYLADESTPCVTLDFVSPSIEASRLHHVAPEPPDSQERIDADARKGACEYFGRQGKGCVGCPAEDVVYTLGDCMRKQTLDLLRRQRELELAGGQA